jgi:DNA-binding MarR family transcriptional regulator
LASNREERRDLSRVRGRKAETAAGRGETRHNRNGVALGVLGDLIGFHLRQAQDASFRAFARHSGDPHMKPGRFAAMMVINNNPGITQVALGRAIARDKSSITPLIQELQRLGLVSRRASPNDRRSITLRLTTAGKRVLDELLAHALDHDRQLDAIVGAKRAELLSLLRRISETFAES